jgi:hypothetical protein
MTGTGTESTELGGVLRLTLVTDHLAHVLEHSQSDEPTGTWTGLACPDHGLEIGTDVDNSALQHLAQGEVTDFIWEAPTDFTAEHGELSLAAISAYHNGDPETGQQYWQQAVALWSRAWSANNQAISLLQAAGLTRFSPDKPQRWVIASFEHHCGPHGVAHPHIHNVAVPALTVGYDGNAGLTGRAASPSA